MITKAKKLPASKRAGRARFNLIDGCKVAAFAGTEKPEAVISTKNEDGSASRYFAP
jgi:hypothetical protein